MDSLLLLALIIAQFVLLAAVLAVIVKRNNQRTDYLLNLVSNLRFADEAESAEQGRSGADPSSEYVASVTTTGPRLHLVDRAVRSMLAQSKPPRGVYLYISDQINVAEIPAKLRALEAHGLTIRQVPDVGPHTKLVYALKEHAQHKIVTFDDDMIYPDNMAACLLHYASAACCLRAGARC